VGGVFLRRQLEKVDETQAWLNHLTILNVISQELKVVPHPLCQYISENAILSNKQNTRCNRCSDHRYNRFALETVSANLAAVIVACIYSVTWWQTDSGAVSWQRFVRRRRLIRALHHDTCSWD